MCMCVCVCMCDVCVHVSVFAVSKVLKFDRGNTMNLPNGQPSICQTFPNTT